MSESNQSERWVKRKTLVADWDMWQVIAMEGEIAKFYVADMIPDEATADRIIADHEAAVKLADVLADAEELAKALEAADGDFKEIGAEIMASNSYELGGRLVKIAMRQVTEREEALTKHRERSRGTT